MDFKFLLERRIAVNLTQSTIADALGYSVQTISLWESGKGAPNLTTWSKYASLLKVDLEGFLFDKGKKDNAYCDINDFDPTQFSNNLKKLRKTKKLTQYALAKKIGTNSSSIIRFEQGSSFPSLEQFIALCNLYHLSVDELYFAIKFEKAPKKKSKRIILPILIPIVVVVSVGGATTGIALSIASKNKSQNKINPEKDNINNDTPTTSTIDDGTQTTEDTSGGETTKDKIKFGYYPQTHVNDSSLISQLEAITTPNENGYYELNDKLYYKETSSFLDEGFRIDGGLFFNDGTKIENNTLYWFNVEPIEWRVTGESEGVYTLFSDLILDCSFYSTGDDKTNNYSTSSLRQFLNNDFLNRSFFSSLPLESEIDNSLTSTGHSVNNYTCENTFDRVFAPSRIELGYVNGYDPDADLKRANRIRLTSEYARIRPIATYADYTASYWTRTPNNNHVDKAYIVDHTGGMTDIYYVDSLYGIAVCPMIKINK